MAIGDRVRLSYPLSKRDSLFGKAFHNQTGVIVGVEADGRTPMYRVRLDNPPTIDGVGRVTDDLWSSEFLKPLRIAEARDHIDPMFGRKRR